MTLPRCITAGPDDPVAHYAPGSSVRPDPRWLRSQHDVELIRLLLPRWLDYLRHHKRLPVVVASAEERNRIAARLTAGELARVDWLGEWPRMEG